MPQKEQEVRDVGELVQIALSPVQTYGLTVSFNRKGDVTLDGAVRTHQAREDAERLASRVPGVRRVVNRLNLDPLVGSMPVRRTVISPELAAEIELTQGHYASGTEDRFNESIGTTDTAIAADEAVPYFAPTDPPVRRAPRAEEGYAVVGGFSQTALDAPIDLEQLPSALTAGDDEIARRVRLALKEDAGTADLPVHVVVREGIVHLRGVVPSLADAELAEEVASRAPGVLDVEEELAVEGI